MTYPTLAKLCYTSQLKNKLKRPNNLQLYVSCPSTFFRSDSPKTTLNCRLGSGSTQPRFLPTKLSIQCAAVITHSLLSKDPPQKMEPSWDDWSPTCHGQFWMEVTLPPTIRLEGSLVLPGSDQKKTMSRYSPSIDYDGYFLCLVPAASIGSELLPLCSFCYTKYGDNCYENEILRQELSTVWSSTFWQPPCFEQLFSFGAAFAFLAISSFLIVNNLWKALTDDTCCLPVA